MGTGTTKHFSGTMGSRSNTLLQGSLFPDKATSNMKQKQSSIFQQGKLKGQNLASHSRKHSQDNEIADDIPDSIFQIFIALCDLLKLRLRKIKNKKLLKFLGDLETDGSPDSSGFLLFNEYFNQKSISPDYGYDIVIDFIARYFSDSSGISIKIQKNEWIAHVNKYKNRK